jgi:hypothetical protein
MNGACLEKEIAAGDLVGKREGKCWSNVVGEVKEMGCENVSCSNLTRDGKKLRTVSLGKGKLIIKKYGR